MGWYLFIFIFSLLAIMVTDTAFRKSRLGKLILEKILPGTSKNWPYHTDLLVFCLKFKLSLVCEYLNYYYNITNDCWTIPEKIKQGGLRTRDQNNRFSNSRQNVPYYQIFTRHFKNPLDNISLCLGSQVQVPPTCPPAKMYYDNFWHASIFLL